jgi:undecaprenyl pyrophosphate phosphatase UppP
MNTPWKSQQKGYEDVPLAMDEIVRSEKESRLAGWVVAVALILANLIGLSVMVVVAQWLMPSVNPLVTAVVATGAYVVGVIGMGIEKLDRRQARMEIHALTLHDEALYNQEKLDEIERRLGFRRI